MYRLMKLYLLPRNLLSLWRERRHVKRALVDVDEKYQALCRSQSR